MDLKSWLAKRDAERKARQSERDRAPRPYVGDIGDANMAKDRWDTILQQQRNDWDAIEREAGRRWDEG